jgi:hypothetical protein
MSASGILPGNPLAAVSRSTIRGVLTGHMPPIRMPPPVYGRPAVGSLSHLFVDRSGDLAQAPQDLLPLAHEGFGLWIGGRIECIHQRDSRFALSVVVKTGENSTVRIDVT